MKVVTYLPHSPCKPRTRQVLHLPAGAVNVQSVSVSGDGAGHPLKRHLAFGSETVVVISSFSTTPTRKQNSPNMTEVKRTARQAALAESKKKQKKTQSKCEEWIDERQDALETLFEACLESLGLAEKKRSFTDFCIWAYDQAAPVLVVSDSEEEEEVDGESDDESEEEEEVSETETEELDSDELESDDPSELDEESVEDEEEDDDDQDEAEETQE